MRTNPLAKALGLIVVALFLTAGCESEQAPVGLTTAELTANIERYQDSLVTVSGEVSDIYSPRIFTIGGSGFGEQLLVISTEPIGAVPDRSEERPVKEQDVVQVTGVAEQFDRSSLEQEYGIDVGDEVADAFAGEPVVVATSGASVLSEVLVTPRTGAARDVPMQAEPITDLNTLATASDPEAYVQRTAVFSDVPIRHVIDNNAFWIGASEDRRLFVTVPEAALQQAPQAGERWTIHGIVRQAPSALELTAEWNLVDSIATQIADDRIYLHGIRAQPSPR